MQLIVYKIGCCYYYQGYDGLYQLPHRLQTKKEVLEYVESDPRKFEVVFEKIKKTECEIYNDGLVRNIF